jgi:O-antigen/teichoic acid export membrane protein
LGLRQAFGYEVGQNHRTPGDAAGTALVLWPVLAVASAAVVFLVYGRQLPGVTATQSAMIITAGVAASLLVILMQGVNLGRGDIRAFAMSETLPRVLLMLLTIAIAVTTGVTLQGALWAYSGGFLIALPVVMYMALKGAGRLRVNLRQLGRSLRFGIIFAVNLLLITLCARLSMFVIEHYMGAAAAGEFYAAIRVTEIFLEAATSVGMVLFSNAARQDSGVSVLRRNARISCWMFWTFMLLGAFVAVGASEIIDILAGSNYRAATPVLQILALSLAPSAASKVIYPTLSGTGHPHFGSPVIIASLLLNAGLACALVPAMGVTGGALALVAGQYLLYAGYVISCTVRFDIPVRDLLVPQWKDTKKPLKSAALRLSRQR